MKTLLKEVEEKIYEEIDPGGGRRIRKETTTKTYFPNADTRHNPSISTIVEYI